MKTPVIPTNIKGDIRDIDYLEVNKRKISTQYEEEQKEKKFAKKHPKSDNVGPVASMRARILAMSLFPNIYNTRYVHSESGAE